MFKYFPTVCETFVSKAKLSAVLKTLIFIDLILPTLQWLRVRLDRIKHQEYFLEGKGGRCVGLTALPTSCADCWEIWDSQSPRNLGTCPGLYRDCFITYTNEYPVDAM